MDTQKIALTQIIKFLLWIHSFSYKVVGYLSQKVEESGIYPKNGLMNYHKFFVDNVDGLERIENIP